MQTEYNTAVRAARSAVNYRKALETKHLYPNLEYIESTASVQREEHLEYVGTILPIEHPWWDTHMPPSAWNCACSVRPTNKDVTEVPPADLVNPVFKNNPGKTAQIVNFKEHPYIKGICPDYTGCDKKDTQQKLDLADNGEEPKCKRICEVAVKAQAKEKKTAIAKRRKSIFDSMVRLYKRNVTRYVGNGKHIKIKFNSKGNSHIVNDYLEKLKGFDEKDLTILDSLLKEAPYVRSSKLIKDRKDNIKYFYYFKEKDREIYYNVAEEVNKLKSGKFVLDRFLYSITNSLNEK